MATAAEDLVECFAYYVITSPGKTSGVEPALPVLVHPWISHSNTKELEVGSRTEPVVMCIAVVPTMQGV